MIGEGNAAPGKIGAGNIGTAPGVIGAGAAKHFPLPEGAADKLDAFHRLLTDANRTMDLTAVIDDNEALTRHYLDSLTALSLLPDGASVVDIGTGAGFPGVPLMIARPDLSIILLDALQKRIAFLRDALGALNLPGKAIHARAEDFAKEHREAFDVAVSRAVASLPVLLEWALPLVRVGGLCIFWKGPGASDDSKEMEDARRVSPLLGGGQPAARPASVPGTALNHRLITVQKIAATPEKFPRKAGMAMKRPL